METEDGITSRNWPVYAKGLGGINLMITFLLIVIGNVFVIIVQLRVKDNSIPTSTKHFIINLAFADLGIGIFIIPFSIATLFDADCCTSLHFQRLSALCNYCLCIVSIMTLAVLSIDRYIAVKFPLRFESIMTAGRAKIMCALVWSYSLAVAVPVVSTSFRYQCIIPNIGSCTLREWAGSPAVMAVTVSLIILTFGLSLGSMFFSYFHIFLAARSQARKIREEAITVTRIEKNLEKRNDSFQMDIKTVEMESHFNRSGIKEGQENDNPYEISSRSVAEFPSTTSGNANDNRSLASKSVLTVNTESNRRSQILNWVEQFRKLSNFGGSSNEEKHHDLSSRHFKTSIALAQNLLLIICIFFLCWSPVCVVLFVEIGSGRKFNPDVNLILMWVAYSNSFCNPIIYCFRYRTFRIALEKVFICIRSKFSRRATQAQIVPFQDKSEMSPARVISRSLISAPGSSDQAFYSG